MRYFVAVTLAIIAAAIYYAPSLDEALRPAPAAKAETYGEHVRKLCAIEAPGDKDCVDKKLLERAFNQSRLRAVR